MIPGFVGDGGHLPLGRYSTTVAEFKERFVDDSKFTDSTSRSKIWADFESSLNILKCAVDVVSVWIGGSYATSKMNPSDIDCLFLVTETQVEKAKGDEQKAKILQEFATSQKLKSAGLLVDNYILVWRAVPMPAMQNPDQTSYYNARGHWDDWWQRHLVDQSSLFANALPRRGYLEVIIDGITE
jgi:hypothetical protein